MNTQQWKDEHAKAYENPPKDGDILKAYGGGNAKMTIELSEGRPPFIYARAFVPNIVGQPIGGWHLHAADSDENYGWKCVLLPKAREEALRRFSNLPETFEVASLRVVRISKAGSAVLCEVAEWAPVVQVAAAA